MPIVQLLLASESDTTIPDPNGFFILDYAVAQRNLDLVFILLFHELNNNIPHRGSYVLHSAVALGNLEMVRLLLVHGVKVNQLDLRAYSPLHFALSGQMNTRGLSLVQILLDHHADANISGPHGVYPLHHAVAGRHARLARMLVHNGANPNVPELYVLHLAVAANDIHLVGMLLSRGVRINERDQRDCSPLHIAVDGTNKARTLRLVDILLENGADISSHYPDGLYVLDHAVVQRNLPLVRLLLLHDAYTNIPEQGWIPFRRAVDDGNMNFVHNMFIQVYRYPVTGHRFPP